ncbi:MAG: HAD family hydrolase, partial [Candidatus Marinimicrobia bacterium]|nr:HAD family hydrolase [Candidatus Neomarinimicrobiota bacterium]
IFGGIQRVLSSFKGIPQGIVSQNSKTNICRHLEKEDLIKNFGQIVGYEEVEIDKQKPEPGGLINCIEKLIGSKSGAVFYIGDHETDIQCAMNANRVLQNTELKICSIGAFYGYVSNNSDWSVQPDYEAHSVQDIFNIINDF